MGVGEKGNAVRGFRDGGEVQKSPGPVAPPSGGKSDRNIAEL